MPRKLLVADKSVVIQKSVGITFAQEDFTVTYVSDGEDALQKVQQWKPDLLLIHIGTPKLSGYEVCDRIRKDPSTKDLPILLFVGIHEQIDEAKEKAVGANGHIVKPFESQALIDRVAELIGHLAQETPLPPEKPAPVEVPGAGEPAFASPPPSPQPQHLLSRAAPLLDLDVPLPDVASAPDDSDIAFELPLDDSLTTETPPELPQEASPKPAEAKISSPGTWDFSEPTQVGAPLEEGIQPHSVEVQEDPFAASASERIPAGETTELFGGPDAALEFSNPVPEASETPPMPETPVREVGFDLTAEREIPTTLVEEERDWSAFGGIVDLHTEPKSSAAVPEPEPAFSAPESEPEPLPFVETPAIEPAPVEAAEKSPGSVESAPSAPLELSEKQIEAIVARVFERVIERIAWEVVPDLAERIIKEELARLTQEKP